MRGNRRVVEQQLAADPSLVRRAAARRPSLIIHAAELGRGEAVRLLAQIGFDVNHLDRRTALHQAAFDGDLELVKLLLELGADRNIEDPSYHATPLGWAEHNNQQVVARYLVEHADVVSAP